MGSIVGILMLIGGISLYRSFAMYKEEKTFDVLNGTVPDFVYKESILNGAYPVLKSSTGAKLIPVTIDEKDGTVRKADIKDEWYKYEDKRWANAVILVDGVTEPKNDEIIPEENIESYFVWIPKYRYKLFDENMGRYETASDKIDETKQNKAIEIEFGLEDTIDDKTNENYKQCKAPGISSEDGSCEVGDWMTHPAFTAFEGSKGFWVGKFETGYNQNSDESSITITVDVNWTMEGAQKNINKSSKVIIKPNVYSWREINLGNMYRTSYEYQRGLDSHMMKNTEWGAVAYLSHSKYGTCENNQCTEVRINNSANKVTGVAAIKQPSLGNGKYQDYDATTPGTDNDKSNVYPRSQKSSTTLNNTGIYDMSGGALEYVMGAITDATSTTEANLDNILWGSSSLTKDNIKDKKYIDIYKNSTDEYHFERRILGDATGEMGPFVGNKSSYFDDYALFIGSSTWFVRSGYYYSGVDAGVFWFSRHSGTNINNYSFRIVLTPQG